MMDSNSSRPRTSRIGGLEQLGKYELVCVLARSDLGSLWASVITYGDGVGQLMAVQRIVIRPGEEETLIDPIREAVDALKNVQRPGVTPVVDCVVSPGRLGVVSEYVEGEPLRSLQNLANLKKTPIPAAVGIRLGLDILEALVAFHGLAAEDESRARFVYGGLSPDTVVVTAQGKAQLLNPGLAAVATSLPSLSWHTGALAYRAPEHLASGSPIDARTDVFVTGVMLWELLAQRALFQTGQGSEPPKSSKRTDQVAIAQQVLTGTIERLDALSLSTAIPKALADVIDKALQRDAAARYGSAREMAEALASAAKDMTATSAQVAAIVESLAASTLSTRRSAIARAGVDLSPESRPMRPVSTDEDDVFGSDWVTDAESGVDDKIHALSAGALAMTPTPSAAIAVGPKPLVSPAKTSGPPRPASLLHTPAPGIVRPKAKAETPALKADATGAKGKIPTRPAAALKPVPRAILATTPKPAPSDPKADDLAFDVDLGDETDDEEIALESVEKPKAPLSRRPPPPPVTTKAAEKPEAQAAAPATSTDKASEPASLEPEVPKPVIDVPPPPKELADASNAFLSGGGDDAFAAPAMAEPVNVGEAEAAREAAVVKEGTTTAGPVAEPVSEPAATDAGAALWKASEPAEQAGSASEEESPISASPSPKGQQAEPVRAEEASVSDADYDDQLAMAAQRRRKGMIALAAVGGLVVVVGIGALIRSATQGEPASGTPTATAAPTPTPKPTPTPVETQPTTAAADPTPAPTPSAEPPPAETASVATTQPAPPATAPKPPPARTGKPKPPKPKPYTPSGI